MPSKNPQGRAESDHPWPLQDIEELINLLVEKEISEFELEKDGVKVRIKRAAPPAPAAAPVPVLFEPIPLAPRSPSPVIGDSPGATGASAALTGQAGAGSAGAVGPSPAESSAPSTAPPLLTRLPSSKWATW
jgi:hypothetical protein